MDEHAKNVVKRNLHKSEQDFKKHLQLCGWSKDEIADMWKHAKMRKTLEKRRGNNG